MFSFHLHTRYKSSVQPKPPLNMARGVPDEDPLAIFNIPPPNEMPEERTVREAKELEAKKISDQIDEQLKADRGAWKKQKNIVRVLLLGQAESGEWR